MKTTTVICDWCGKDITHTSNCEDYRLVLSCESIPSQSGVVTCMHIEPDFDGVMTFCKLGCLQKWLKERMK